MSEIAGLNPIGPGDAGQAAVQAPVRPEPARPQETRPSAPAPFRPDGGKRGDRLKPEDMERLDELNGILERFNRRIRFDVEEEGMVVVQIVDRETNDVIKTLPPEALRRLMERMDEAVGLILDEAL